MKKTLFFLAILLLALPHSTHAAAFYVDFVNGNDANAGTATTTAFQDLHKFTDVARNAGDIAFVRRGQASTTNVTAVTFTSDGTLNNPITVSADYDNLWNDNSTSSESVTVTTWGSTTGLTASASSTIPNGSWIYLQGDCKETYNSTKLNPCEYAYEVASSSAGTANTTITLYLPYKGKQTGSGINVRIMKSAPQIGSAAEANQIFTMSLDDYWYFKGLDLRSTNASCVIVPSGRGAIFFDMVLQGNGAGDCGTGSGTTLADFFYKLRVFNVVGVIGAGLWGGINIQNFLGDCNGVSSSLFASNPANNGQIVNLTDGVIKCTTDFGGTQTIGRLFYYLRNVLRRATSQNISGGVPSNLYAEDDFSTPGLNSQSSEKISASTVSTTTMSTSTNLRAGGGPVNEAIFPPSGTGNTGISTAQFPFSYYKLFEYPVYAAANTAKTYTFYFNSTSTAQWTTNPTVASSTASSTPELFIECEYYNDATDANRLLLRSSDVPQSAVNFTGSTAWQSLAVTCTPAQSGIIYLRGWYGKPKETGGNIFYLDTTPVVS